MAPNSVFKLEKHKTINLNGFAEAAALTMRWY
jgi:hypothetical protein